MADKVQRPKSHVLQGLDWGKSFYYTHEADAFIENLQEREEQAYQETLRARKSEAEIEAKVKSLHAAIIEQGRKVQIAASGESKYGAMSDSEFIEWMLNLLEGKCQE